MAETSLISEMIASYGVPTALLVMWFIYDKRESKAEKEAQREREKEIQDAATRREERLMDHLDLVNETQTKICATLDRQEHRIEKIEDHLDFYRKSQSTEE